MSQIGHVNRLNRRQRDAGLRNAASQKLTEVLLFGASRKRARHIASTSGKYAPRKASIHACKCANRLRRLRSCFRSCSLLTDGSARDPPAAGIQRFLFSRGEATLQNLHSNRSNPPESENQEVVFVS